MLYEYRLSMLATRLSVTVNKTRYPDVQTEVLVGLLSFSILVRLRLVRYLESVKKKKKKKKKVTIADQPTRAGFVSGRAWTVSGPFSNIVGSNPANPC